MNILAFTAYRRPQYWEPTLRSWAQVRGIERWDVRIHLEPSPHADQMIALANVLLPQAEVRLNSEVRGVLVNPWEAMEDAFSECEYAVLAEEDILVSTDILEFFEWANVALKYRPVLAACSFQGLDAHGGGGPEPAREEPYGPAEVYLHHWFSPLVWGTWRGRWTEILSPTWDKDYSSGPQDEAGWDWNLRRMVQAPNGWRCAFPRLSRSSHIGVYGGAHMTPNLAWTSIGPTFEEERPSFGYELTAGGSST